MATVSIVRLQDGPYLIYNVDYAVGPGALNRRDDVLLVQYFLQVAFDTGHSFQEEPFPGDLRVTGTPDQDTFDAILLEKVQKKRGRNIATDGRVDPPVGEHVVLSIPNTQYTIISLNLFYANGRPADWPKVSQASDCPGELRRPLKEPTFARPPGR